MKSNQNRSLEVCLLCFRWHGVVTFLQNRTDGRCSGTCSQVFLPQAVRNRISCGLAAFLPNRAWKCSKQSLDSGLSYVLRTLVLYLGLPTNSPWHAAFQRYLVSPVTSWVTVDLSITFRACMNIFLTCLDSSCNIIFYFKKALPFIFKKLSLSSSQVTLVVYKYS